MDIDIDFVDRQRALDVLKHVKSSRIEDGKSVAHNTGVYFQPIPYDPVSNLATVDYKTAEQRGYFKIDFLNAGVYKGIESEQHLDRLMTIEPLWDLLEQEDFVNLLFHVSGHGAVLKSMKPASIEQLAAVLAVIRPAKRHLIGKSWSEVFDDVWKKPDNGEYYFKKAHAVAYAMAIVVQMNLICEQLSLGYS
jgi:DNA polymerase III alpha subunit